MKKISRTIITVIFILLCWVTPSLAKEQTHLNHVVVQIRECHRTWNNGDVIIMSMSTQSWEQWKKEQEFMLNSKAVRFAYVNYQETYNRVKDYQWIDYRLCW